jgi:hypothetical protein
MTDRISHLTVTLTEDIRTDDVEHIINAIQMIRHVGSVTMGKPVDVTDYMAREHAKIELRSKILDVFK